MVHTSLIWYQLLLASIRRESLHVRKVLKYKAIVYLFYYFKLLNWTGACNLLIVKKIWKTKSCVQWLVIRKFHVILQILMVIIIIWAHCTNFSGFTSSFYNSTWRLLTYQYSFPCDIWEISQCNMLAGLFLISVYNIRSILNYKSFRFFT